MTIQAIGDFFPEKWVYGSYERLLFDGIVNQVQQHFPDANNVVFSLTWDGPQTLDAIKNLQGPVDNLFLVSTVDAVLSKVDNFIQLINPANVYKIGNFDSKYSFNFFAIVCQDHFQHYETEDLILRDLRIRWISYNRKPYEHRRSFVHLLNEQNLIDTGTVTLGRHFPGDTRPELYLSIGEKNHDYVQYGHWYDDLDGVTATPHEIPHDLFSLHNWYQWQHHFLHIVGCTEINNENHVYVNQIDFKPLIGMRPFIINGQTRKYQWWRDQGFRTFESWFPTDLLTENTLTQQLVETVRYVNSLSLPQLQSMYDSMLPDLLHNRNRWFEWADEQKKKAGSLF